VDRVLADFWDAGRTPRDLPGRLLPLSTAFRLAQKETTLMAAPKNYRTYQDFEREEIRPSFKVGFSMEDLVEEATFE
ncbi:hypothetical protein ACSTKX_24680, partial [Vibrio parahaemolyticus]